MPLNDLQENSAITNMCKIILFSNTNKITEHNFLASTFSFTSFCFIRNAFNESDKILISSRIYLCLCWHSTLKGSEVKYDFKDPLHLLKFMCYLVKKYSHIYNNVQNIYLLSLKFFFWKWRYQKLLNECCQDMPSLQENSERVTGKRI